MCNYALVFLVLLRLL